MNDIVRTLNELKEDPRFDFKKNQTPLQKKMAQLKKAEQTLENFTDTAERFKNQDFSAFEEDENFNREGIALVIKRHDRMLRGMVKLVDKYRGQVEELKK